jgi:purine-binding chemotaxis protein CheW
MTETMSHLSFIVAGRRHAMPMSCLQELLYVPLLQPTERVSGNILGVFNLRGEPIPVLDLPSLLDLPGRPASTEDVLLLFRPPSGSGPYGMLVDSVEDLLVFQPEELRDPLPDPLAEPLSPLVARLGMKGERIHHLLDLELLAAAINEGMGPRRFESTFGALDPAVEATLRTRAEEASGRREEERSGRFRHLEITLGGEHFAVPLAANLLITKCPPVFPVPGAPKAILGLVNNGGEALLVVDLRAILGMASGTLLPEAHLLVVEDGSAALGLYADEIGEVIEVGPEGLQAHPTRAAGSLLSGEWLSNGKVVHVLDFPLVLAAPGLTLSPSPS